MKLIRTIHNIKDNYGPCVLTIGNFDGLHLGHQMILKQLKEQASILSLPAKVMLFEPQPREFFQSTKTSHSSQDNTKVPARLTRLRDKITLLQNFNVDQVICINFNGSFAQLTAQNFIKQLLVKLFKDKVLIIGDDFYFGRAREGNFAMLKKAGEKFNFNVICPQTFSIHNTRVSSSLIRQALMQNNLSLAAKMLGRKYSISGKVSHGRKLGQTIGFPTANIPLKRHSSPVLGVYIVQVLDLKTTHDKLFYGVANIGNRPTVGGTKQLLEVHLFNFNDNLYGKNIEVLLLHKLRNEQKFLSIDALKQQIASDILVAKRWIDQNITLNQQS